MKHYAQLTDADMREAAKMAVLKDAENTVQKSGHQRGQNMTEMSRKDSQEIQEDDIDNLNNPLNCKSLSQLAKHCDKPDNSYPVARAGPDPQPAMKQIRRRILLV